MVVLTPFLPQAVAVPIPGPRVYAKAEPSTSPPLSPPHHENMGSPYPEEYSQEPLSPTHEASPLSPTHEASSLSQDPSHTQQLFQAQQLSPAQDLPPPNQPSQSMFEEVRSPKHEMIEASSEQVAAPLHPLSTSSPLHQYPVFSSTRDDISEQPPGYLVDSSLTDQTQADLFGDSPSAQLPGQETIEEETTPEENSVAMDVVDQSNSNSGAEIYQSNFENECSQSQDLGIEAEPVKTESVSELEQDNSQTGEINDSGIASGVESDNLSNYK